MRRHVHRAFPTLVVAALMLGGCTGEEEEAGVGQEEAVGVGVGGEGTGISGEEGAIEGGGGAYGEEEEGL